MSNPTLPISTRVAEIVDTIRRFPVTIVVGETGSGKTTALPAALLGERELADGTVEPGDTVVVTQPRIPAARNAAAYVAQNLNSPLGGMVGYRTAKERKDNGSTDLLYATDGLQLVRELMRHGDYRVLVIDEAHERNLNIDVLMAWARREIRNDASFRLVVMSATIDAEKFSAYFDGAPIITVEGRTYPVKWKRSARSVVDEAIDAAKAGKNALVFQRGKADVSDVVQRIEKSSVEAVVLPLHAEMSPEEQQRCFQSYDIPKIVVATNVAQTSVTIPDVHIVIDSGDEKRTETRGGVEGLYIASISQADCRQRAGRAGRTGPGEYILCSRIPFEERPEWPIPEIQRVSLRSVMLRIANAGLHMGDLEFMDPPSAEAIQEAREVLQLLGALDDQERITPLGRQLSFLPVEPELARMLVQARRSQNYALMRDVAAIVACMSAGGIRHRNDAWRDLTSESQSDLLAELDLLRQAEKTKGGFDALVAVGIHPIAYKRAREKYVQLLRELRVKNDEKHVTTREEVLKACLAGMTHRLYTRTAGYSERVIARESIHNYLGEAVLAFPFNVQFQYRRGGKGVHYLLNWATKVSIDLLAEVAPEHVSRNEGLDPRYDWDRDEVVSTTETWFNGQQVGTHEVLDPEHAEAARLRREGRNERQWRNWTERPEISLPDPTDESAVIPEIVVYTYGADAETGEPLLAYGTVWADVNPARVRQFAPAWFRSERQAMDANARAIKRLETVRAEAKAAAERQRKLEEAEQLRQRKAEEAERLRQAAEPLRGRIAELWRTHGYNYDLPAELRNRMYSGSQLPHGADPVTMLRWMVDTEALIAEVNVELEAIEARKAEAAARLAQLTETARSLRDEANGLLVDYESALGNSPYNRLAKLDVDDYQLPDDIDGLDSWIMLARRAISDAEEHVARPEPATPKNRGKGQIGDDALSALAARFNNHK